MKKWTKCKQKSWKLIINKYVYCLCMIKQWCRCADHLCKQTIILALQFVDFPQWTLPITAASLKSLKYTNVKPLQSVILRPNRGTTCVFASNRKILARIPGSISFCHFCEWIEKLFIKSRWLSVLIFLTAIEAVRINAYDIVTIILAIFSFKATSMSISFLQISHSKRFFSQMWPCMLVS